MGHKIRVALAVAALACGLSVLLTGCFMQSGDAMYAIPQAAEEYQNLDSKIKEVMTSLGAEYAAPLSGANTQTIQLQDLDGDGVRESAVAFFRVNNAEKPLRIYIFTRQPDDSYQTSCVIEGDGAAIYSISYENLGGGDAKEVVVSWQASATVHTLAAYSLAGEEAIELMRTSYTKFKIIDIDADNEREIVAIQLDSGEISGRAELYDYVDASMTLCSTAPLSNQAVEIKSVRAGNLKDSIPALFVYSVFGEEKSQAVDILTWKDGGLENIILDETTGMSRETMRYYIASGQDINKDQIMELPQAKPLPEYNSTSTVPNYWVLNWRQFDANGGAWPVYSTYHNTSDGWYLILPEHWADRITVSRRDLSSTGERRVVFSLWNGAEREPVDFLTIYTFTGANRANRATVGNRQILMETGTTIYACEFNEEGWDCGLDRDSLLERFTLIRSEWFGEN